jgi:hypothetical protein
VRKKDFNLIKKSFEDNGCVLLTTRYRNSRQKLKYICSNGHNCSITWGDWHSGRRCNICSTEKGAKKRRMDFSVIKENFEKDGFHLITTENQYKNCDQRLDCICSNGHEHSISWHNWKNGWRCPYCSGNARKTIEEVRSGFEKHGYILATNIYINCHTKLPLICPNGHEWSISWNNWGKGTRCPRCSDAGVSKWEKEVKTYVSSLNIDYISNYRDKSFLCSPDTGRPLELDIWVPNLNKAIECNGIYWHSLKRKQFLDGIKQQFCNKSNIDLLIITDQEWNSNIKFCKSKIQNFLSV